jgi:hypothetical protein
MTTSKPESEKASLWVQCVCTTLVVALVLQPDFVMSLVGCLKTGAATS